MLVRFGEAHIRSVFVKCFEAISRVTICRSTPLRGCRSTPGQPDPLNSGVWAALPISISRVLGLESLAMAPVHNPMTAVWSHEPMLRTFWQKTSYASSKILKRDNRMAHTLLWIHGRERVRKKRGVSDRCFLFMQKRACIDSHLCSWISLISPFLTIYIQKMPMKAEIICMSLTSHLLWSLHRTVFVILKYV